jgi:anti-anti-sigma factor
MNALRRRGEGLLAPGERGALYATPGPITHGVAIVELQGSLDRATVPILREKIARQLAGGAKNLVLDFSRAEILDEDGIELLAAYAAMLGASSGTFLLAAVRPRTTAFLRQSELGRELRVHHGVEQAVAGGSA